MAPWFQRLKFKRSPTGIYSIIADGSKKIISYQSQRFGVIRWHPLLSTGPILPQMNNKCGRLKDLNGFCINLICIHVLTLLISRRCWKNV
jgi:hypothetical protein